MVSVVITLKMTNGDKDKMLSIEEYLDEIKPY